MLLALWGGRDQVPQTGGAMHAHAYDREANEATLQRLVADVRVLAGAGIERAAWAWDRHERDNLAAYHAAERAALATIEAANLGPAWDELRRNLFGMMEGGPYPLIEWKAEHGEVGHKAERAAFGAAMGLVTQGLLSHDQYTTLVRPMAEVLPWLLPEIPPAPHRP
jgi:hypothetical protein